MNQKEIIKWIGLAKVTVLNESNILNGDKLAYTNAVGLSKTKTEFRNEVKNKLYSMDLKLLRLESTEPFAERLEKHKVDNEIIKIANRLSVKNLIEFSTFHTYPENKNPN